MKIQPKGSRMLLGRRAQDRSASTCFCLLRYHLTSLLMRASGGGEGPQRTFLSFPRFTLGQWEPRPSVPPVTPQALCTFERPGGLRLPATLSPRLAWSSQEHCHL